MPKRTLWRAACAGLLALVVGAAVLVGCQSTDEQPAARSTWSFDGYSVLQPWTYAMQGSDDEAANVVVLGDSVSEGYGLDGHLERRWVDRLERALRARSGVEDCPTEPAGYHGSSSVIPARYHAPSIPDPATAGHVSPQPAAGPGGRALDLRPGASVTWEVEAESVDIGYRTRPEGGNLRVTIDGTIPLEGVSIPTASDANGDAHRTVWSSDDLGPGTHTVRVSNSSSVLDGSLTTVTDLTPYRGDRDRCVHVLDASRSGATAKRITQTPSYLADALSLEPDLLLVPLGFNDARAGSSPAVFGRTLDRLITQVRAEGYDGPVLLVGWFEPRYGTDIAPWPEYIAEMGERTSHDGVSFLDLSVVLPPVRGAPQGTYLDSLHPSADAQPAIARSLVEALAPRGDFDSGAG